MYFTESSYIFVNKYGILRVLYRVFDRCSAIFLLAYFNNEEAIYLWSWWQGKLVGRTIRYLHMLLLLL